MARIQDIIWFNPPFSHHVNNIPKISKISFNIVDKNFLAGHKYRPIFNRSCLKLLYSVTPNLWSILAGSYSLKFRNSANIRSHDKSNGNNNDQTGHNDLKSHCWVRKWCHLDGTYLRKNVINKVWVIIANQPKKLYI